jgi:hypothetical protein
MNLSTNASELSPPSVAHPNLVGDPCLSKAVCSQVGRLRLIVVR